MDLTFEHEISKSILKYIYNQCFYYLKYFLKNFKYIENLQVFSEKYLSTLLHNNTIQLSSVV